MLRFARAPDGLLVCDLGEKLPGAGAWTCCKAACVRRGIDKGNFARAFEAPILCDVGVEQLIQDISAQLERRALDVIGLLRCTGQLSVGHDEVVRLCNQNNIGTILLADDAAQRLSTFAQAWQTSGDDRVVVFAPNKAAVAAAIGKDDAAIAIAGVGRTPLALSLRRAAGRWRAFVAPRADTPSQLSPFSNHTHTTINNHGAGPRQSAADVLKSEAGLGVLSDDEKTRQ